ncbi:SIR2 family protein [Paenibacillus sp. MSJ-34]|uniref:SIR2 family protein n=1 Tax=Paenibacillus sp. MSJ-34 TaxID=2841529 RepID=UPI001C11E545|nr:SIR2 family protein [Paenibacillus sp. MSJ-34]MBU5445585.1 SIR2 family protein [Paenibacillus sp. MSJ-34]
MRNLENAIDWEHEHILKVNRSISTYGIKEKIVEEEARKEIEPWLSAIFQSEHLSVLLGAGLTTAVTSIASLPSQGMWRIDFDGVYKEHIKIYADKKATKSDRGKANLEDDLRTAFELLAGLQIAGQEEDALQLKTSIESALSEFISTVLKTEEQFKKALEAKFEKFDIEMIFDEEYEGKAEQEKLDYQKKAEEALSYLKSFLTSFASRTASRDRLNIFTTNYDRFIEYACDMAGILLLDRFIGKISPIMRSTKLELDYHYNPPGIRGEPRYVEGVARYTKMHGSIDWKFQGKKIVREPLQFGASNFMKESAEAVVIYPNSSKDIETDFFPYADMFRDFSAALCRPNSALVVYGYSFGDSHINRIIEDMLTLPSTHLVIIAYEDSAKRIKRFYEKHNPAQITLLIGSHFSDLKYLVDWYLPKAAIDKISVKAHELKERRGDKEPQNKSGEGRFDEWDS